MATRAFDLIGDVAVIDVDSNKEEKRLIETILNTYPRVKSIVKIVVRSQGTYRLREYKIVYKDMKKIKASGLGVTETIHKEHGCSFKLDVRKAFFNPRDSTIRQTIINHIKDGERILVMFSGIAPFSVIIGKKFKRCEVVGVDINPDAVGYAEENVRINKVQERVFNIHGDLRKLYNRLGKFDRVIMPLGLTAYKFLDIAFKVSKRGGTVHMYCREDKDKLYEFGKSEIKKAALKAKKKFSITGKREMRTTSTSEIQVVFDFKVL